MTLLNLSYAENIRIIWFEDAFVVAAVVGRYNPDEDTLETFNTLGIQFEPNLEFTNILGVTRLPDEPYDQQNSYEDVASNMSSWWFDYTMSRTPGVQVLYIHVEHDLNPMFLQEFQVFSHNTSAGVSSIKHISVDSAFLYDPDILQAPQISAEQTLQDYDRPSLLNARIVIANTRGQWNFLNDTKIINNPVQVLFIDDQPGQNAYTSSDVVPIQSATIGEYEITPEQVSIELIDPNNEGAVGVPVDVFSIADYPDIEEDLIGEPIPLAYGALREIPLICVNGTKTTSDVVYKAARSLTSVGDVYVRIGDIWVQKTSSSSDAATATVTLSAANARDSGSPLEAKLVGPVGELDTAATAADVIIDLNETALGLDFTGSHYDIAEWASETAGFAPVGVYIDERRELGDVIADLQNGSNIGFRYDRTASGLRTIRIDDNSRPSVAHAFQSEIFNRDTMPIKYDPKLYAAIIEVKYHRSWVSGRFLRELNTDNNEIMQEQHGIRRTREVTTFLVNQSDAEARASYEAERNSTIRGVVELFLTGPRFVTLRVLDIITAEIAPIGRVDATTGEIHGGNGFAGVVKLKVLRIEPDLDNKTNKIAAQILGSTTVT